ncbi:hypothetical protein [[Phormidium] sp. ETS-05]|uniref:hypothetical protein n=1 Tax=[Phormidium] sp. ETS-05 TaxID=222819 RepID=UPI001E3222B7|nr:hypothetical protein [[Phormidium] sp. ETS-05]
MSQNIFAVLDASALLAYLQGESDADVVAHALLDDIMGSTTQDVTVRYGNWRFVNES